jgi:hypothetical protein
VFLQPILQVLLPQSQSVNAEDCEAGFEGLSLDNKHGFLNISVTPVECSVVCHTSWAKRVFEPVLKSLPKDAAKTVSISKDSYLALLFISSDMDAGSRVVDLSSPLALAGIPIFFITTYYSDFILVPRKDRHRVVQALFATGFEFAEDESSFVSRNASHTRGPSATSEPPSTPPPTNVAELQLRTFELLKKRHVSPFVDSNLNLIHCSGRKMSSRNGDYLQRPSVSRTHTGTAHQSSWVDTVDTRLYTCLVAALAGQPKFLSVTLAQDDLPSLLLDKSLLPLFGESLLGDIDKDLVPIFLDLVNLPFEATGIVSGVAGRLVSELRMAAAGQRADGPELSYLSTSKAGAVILPREQSQKAIEILEPLLPKS